MKERNHAFDLLCGLCIVRMVSLHIMGFCGQSDEQWWQHVMMWTYFFMSFFFFKAGYFNHGVDGDTRQYLAEKTKRLFVPYLTAGWIGMIIYFAFMPYLIERYNHPIETLEWSHLWENSGFYGNRPTWFLFSFFMTYVAVHFIEKVRWLHWAVVAFPIVSYSLYTMGNPLWMSMDNVFMGIFFFYLGKAWHEVMKRLPANRTMLLSVVLTVGFVAMNCMWKGDYTMSDNTFTGSFPTMMLKTVLAMCGISGLLLSLRIPRLPWICYIGEHSMVYFISHYPLIYIYKFTHLSFGRSIYGKPEEVLILIPVVFCVCSWLVPYVEAVPWLSGRYNKK